MFPSLPVLIIVVPCSCSHSYFSSRSCIAGMFPSLLVCWCPMFSCFLLSPVLVIVIPCCFHVSFSHAVLVIVIPFVVIMFPSLPVLVIVVPCSCSHSYVSSSSCNTGISCFPVVPMLVPYFLLCQFFSYCYHVPSCLPVLAIYWYHVHHLC